MKKFIIAYLVLLVVLAIVSLSEAHEDNNWVHATEDITGIVYRKTCPMSIRVLSRDINGDGEVDRCTGTIYTHGLFHTRSFEMTIVQDYNGNDKIGCSCEMVKDGI
jgi:hypothetical protein